MKLNLGAAMASQLIVQLNGVCAERDALRKQIVDALCVHFDRGGYCNECGGQFPCFTRRALEKASS